MNQVYELTHETAGGIKGERESQRETCAEVRARAARGPAYFLILDSAGAPGKKKKFEDAANPGSDSGGTRSGGVSEVSADPPGLPWSLSLIAQQQKQQRRAKIGPGSGSGPSSLAVRCRACRIHRITAACAACPTEASVCQSGIVQDTLGVYYGTQIPLGKRGLPPSQFAIQR